jgi:Holliday junction resolvase
VRRAAKVDATQAAIVKALRDAGCKVLSLAACGKGVPDLLVKTPDRVEVNAVRWSDLFLLEVKNPAGRGTGLTPDQVKFHAEWPVTVVTTPEEALRAVGL